jgi:hypothetical protein
LGVSARLTADEINENGGTSKDKKLLMTSGVSRKLRQAEATIGNVVKGQFPIGNWAMPDITAVNSTISAAAYLFDEIVLTIYLFK